MKGGPEVISRAGIRPGHGGLKQGDGERGLGRKEDVCVCPSSWPEVQP